MFTRETIFVPKGLRTTLLIIFFYGGILNAIIFLFLYLTLYFGYDPLELKSLV